MLLILLLLLLSKGLEEQEQSKIMIKRTGIAGLTKPQWGNALRFTCRAWAGGLWLLDVLGGRNVFFTRFPPLPRWRPLSEPLLIGRH